MKHSSTNYLPGRISQVFVGFSVILAILLALNTELPAKQIPANSSGDELWIKEDLPSGAVAQYGSTHRNPNAVGVQSLRFSADGKLLAVKDVRQNIRILDLANQKLSAVLRTERSEDFDFTPDAEFIALGKRKTTNIWSIAKRDEVRSLNQPGYKVTGSGDSLILAGRGVVNRYSWPLPSKPVTSKTKLKAGTVLPIGLSKDGRMAVFHNGKQLEVLDTSTGKPLDSVPMTVFRQAIFSNNSQLLATFNPGGQKLMLHDLRNAKKYQFEILDKRRITTTVFSNDDRFLFTSNNANEIVVWDLATMQQVTQIAGHESRIRAMAAHPRHLFALASGSSGEDRSVIYWDLRDTLFPPLEEMEDFDLDRVWYDLGSAKASESLAATNQLSQALQNDAELFESLAVKLELASLAEGDDKIAKLIGDLDDQKYLVREKATIRLSNMVDQIRPQLERCLASSSQEAKWRIAKILQTDKQKPSFVTTDGRRKIRVILSLELCGGEDSKALLNRMAEACHDANIVNRAKLALGRLSDVDM